MINNKFFKLINLILISQAYIFSLNIDINQLKDKDNIIYLAILGSGPAGLSAGIYGARFGIHTVVFSGPKPGGQLRDGILVENWPGVIKDSGANIMHSLENQAKSFGAHIVNDVIQKVDFSSWPFKLYGQEKVYHTFSVIIATGASEKKLGIEGEDKYWLKGILSCPICDGHLVKNKPTVVIGGGDSAVERILQLVPYAREVTLILRSDKMRAAYDMYKKIKNFPQVNILFNKKVKRFTGDKNRLTGINIYDNITGQESILETHWTFLAIGFEPNSSIFKDQLELNPEKYIKHNCQTQETNIKGVYVAGNVSDNIYKQASTAAGDATKAATNAVKFLLDLPIDKTLKENIKQKLYYPTPEKIIKISKINSDEQFNKIVQEQQPVVIEFYSPFCSTCKSMQSIIESVAFKYKNKIKFYKVDILRNKALVRKYSVAVVPEILIFSDNKILSRINGQLTKTQLSNFIEKNIKN